MMPYRTISKKEKYRRRLARKQTTSDGRRMPRVCTICQRHVHVLYLSSKKGDRVSDAMCPSCYENRHGEAPADTLEREAAWRKLKRGEYVPAALRAGNLADMEALSQMANANADKVGRRWEAEA